MRDVLERQQVWIYFAAVALAAITGVTVSGTGELESAINPALAFMLFVTFLQVPLPEIAKGLRQRRFLGALLVSNFIAIPILAFLLAQLAIDDRLLRLGILMVLLTPCIDYVITFAHLGGQMHGCCCHRRRSCCWCRWPCCLFTLVCSLATKPLTWCVPGHSCMRLSG